MKTNDKVKKSRIPAVEFPTRFQTPAAAWDAQLGLSTAQVLDSSTSESTEQSENVYENKGSPRETPEVLLSSIKLTKSPNTLQPRVRNGAFPPTAVYSGPLVAS
jgi:hypothetical protein